MTLSLLVRYVRDKLGVVLTFYANTVIILILVSVLSSYEGIPPSLIKRNAGYALFLTTTILVAHFIIDLLYRWPFARQVNRLLDSDIKDIRLLVDLPQPGSLEQSSFQDLIAKLYRLSVEEQLRYKEAHKRHLAFMNLWVHQMKTPVSAISLLVQRQDERDPDRISSILSDIDEESGKLEEGLEMVLNMARLEDFEMDYHIRRVDLLGTLRRVINMRKKQFIRAGVFPDVKAEQGDWIVFTDEKWNEVVIEQIISNTLKYSSHSETEVKRLVCSLCRLERSIILTIADNGPGIPPEDLPRVFEPFFTGENGRRFGGATGIGLYMVKQIIDRLGHEIAITSKPGEGTTVTLTYTVENEF